MGFWEYPDSSGSEDEDSGSGNGPGVQGHASVPLRGLDGPSLSDLNDRDKVNGTSKKKAPVIAYDDDDAMPSPPRKKKRKSVMKAMDLPNDPAVTINNEEALRLEQIRAQALQAFKDDDEDDDGDDGEEADHEEAENRPSAPIRPIGGVVEVLDDDEDDVERELKAEQERLLREESNATNKMVLKVVCKHGNVQIRQQAGSNFVELMRKFREHAVQKGWAKRSSKMTLLCDDEHIDLEKNTPEDFDLEDDMVVDVRIQ